MATALREIDLAGLDGFAIDGLESPFGTCPVGSINTPLPAMLHVWTVANPGGPFADDLSPAFVARLTRQEPLAVGPDG